MEDGGAAQQMASTTVDGVVEFVAAVTRSVSVITITLRAGEEAVVANINTIEDIVLAARDGWLPAAITPLLAAVQPGMVIQAEGTLERIEGSDGCYCLHPHRVTVDTGVRTTYHATPSTPAPAPAPEPAAAAESAPVPTAGRGRKTGAGRKNAAKSHKVRKCLVVLHTCPLVSQRDAACARSKIPTAKLKRPSHSHTLPPSLSLSSLSLSLLPLSLIFSLPVFLSTRLAEATCKRVQALWMLLVVTAISRTA